MAKDVDTIRRKCMLANEIQREDKARRVAAHEKAKEITALVSVESQLTNEIQTRVTRSCKEDMQQQCARVSQIVDSRAIRMQASAMTNTFA